MPAVHFLGTSFPVLQPTTNAKIVSPLSVQDAWLEAESVAAAAQVEAILYSEQGWGPGQQLIVEEGTPAWQVTLWPPRAAEEVGRSNLQHLVQSAPSNDVLETSAVPQVVHRHLKGVTPSWRSPEKEDAPYATAPLQQAPQ